MHWSITRVLTPRAPACAPCEPRGRVWRAPPRSSRHRDAMGGAAPRPSTRTMVLCPGTRVSRVRCAPRQRRLANRASTRRTIGACGGPLTHAMTWAGCGVVLTDGFCNKNADQLGSLAGLSFPAVHVGVVECAPAFLPPASSSLQHIFAPVPAVLYCHCLSVVARVRRIATRRRAGSPPLPPIVSPPAARTPPVACCPLLATRCPLHAARSKSGSVSAWRQWRQWREWRRRTV
jgi:hypothetical protein